MEPTWQTAAFIGLSYGLWGVGALLTFCYLFLSDEILDRGERAVSGIVLAICIFMFYTAICTGGYFS